MNQTQDDSKNLSVDDILSLHGEDLKKALDARIKAHNDAVSAVEEELAGVVEYSKNLGELDVIKNADEDDQFIDKLEKDLNKSLNDAVLDLATDDDILEDIK